MCLYLVNRSRKLLFLYSIEFRNIMLSIHGTISQIGKIISQTTGTTGISFKVLFHRCYMVTHVVGVHISSRSSRPLEFLSFSRTCHQLDISLSVNPSFKHLINKFFNPISIGQITETIDHVRYCATVR